MPRRGAVAVLRLALEGGRNGRLLAGPASLEASRAPFEAPFHSLAPPDPQHILELRRNGAAGPPRLLGGRKGLDCLLGEPDRVEVEERILCVREERGPDLLPPRIAE